MDPHSADADASRARIAGAATLRLELLQEAEEDRQVEQRRPGPWPLLVALLALVLIVPAFYWVVRDGLQQSEWRQQAQSQHDAALTQCNSLPGRDGGGPCQLRVKAEARRAADLGFPGRP